MLGVEIEINLTFDEYISTLSKNPGRKQCILPRLSQYMIIKHKCELVKAFIGSQFGYCPLVWMFTGRLLDKKYII